MAILEASEDAFLRRGYDGVSMDEIAAASGVAKQTLYKHFADKERLFTAVILRAVRRAGDAVHAATLDFRDSGDVEADLRQLARQQLALVMTPEIMRLRRIVISTADRLPTLGQAFYAEGPGRTIAALADLLEVLAGSGRLVIDDYRAAAAHLNWMIMSIPVNKVMLLGDAAMPSRVELENIADQAVRLFISAYGRARSAPAT